MKTELKPCPFCGSDNVSIQDMSDGGFCVECQDCPCVLGDISWGGYHIGEGANEGEFSTPEEATEKWNTRHKLAE